MVEIASTYRLVQLEYAIEQWDDPSIRRLIERTLTLRLQGYGSKYPGGVVPFDASAWYATHFLVCAERGGLQPIMGFQRVTLQSCGMHYAQFPPLASCRQSGCARHIEAMEKLIARFEGAPEKLSYTGGFTIEPGLRADRELIAELRTLMVVLHYLFHRDAGEEHEIVTAPIIRFRIDELLASYGFEPLLEPPDEGVLALGAFAGERTRFMRARRFNRHMVERAGHYEAWWNDRVLLRNRAGADTRSEEPTRRLEQVAKGSATRAATTLQLRPLVT